MPVNPELLMCLKHLRIVPKKIYGQGKWDDKNPSKEWTAAAVMAIDAVFLKGYSVGLA